MKKELNNRQRVNNKMNVKLKLKKNDDTEMNF